MEDCRNCNKRVIGCHSKCSTYKAFKEKLEKKNKHLKREKDAIRVSQEGFWRRLKEGY